LVAPLVASAWPPDLFDRVKHLLDSANVGEPQGSPGTRSRSLEFQRGLPGWRYSRSRRHVSGQKLLHAHIMERQHVNGVDRENIVVNVDFTPVHHWSAPPLPLASRFRSNRNRSGMTSSTLHRSQQWPAATGCALLPKPVYSPPQIEQYGPPQIEHV
jgi:hypothetical protein